MTTPRILISHPHAAAYANGAASGFERAGMLATYATGIAAAERTARGALFAALGRLRPVVHNRLLRGVAADHLKPHALLEIAARAGASAASRAGLRTKAYDWVFVSHDAAVAATRWPRAIDAVYAYEDGALHTFQRAARLGLERIWDLPLPHWRAIQTLLEEESRRWPDAAGPTPVEPAWKRMRKEQELAFATAISVASAFTRASLEDFGVRQPIVTVPYGFPVEQFVPKRREPDGPFTVVAVGSHDLRKGTPYLLEAWRRAGLTDARLRLVGPMRLRRTFVDRYAGMFEHVPHVPRALLASEYHRADVLVFPTLGDGFGMVIQEAMCCGTPVVTTPCGGGPESIRHGVDGWIVPPRDIDALIALLRQLAKDRDGVAKAGRLARQHAETYDWEAAGRNMASSVGALLQGR